MEVRRARGVRLVFSLVGVLFLLMAAEANAQPVMAYTIKQGRMFIELGKPVTEAALDSFIFRFDLADLDLKSLLKFNNHDSLFRQGWKVEANNDAVLIVSKGFEPFTGLGKPGERFFFQDRPAPVFPAVNNGLTYGINNFRNKSPFSVRDSVVRFFLRNHQRAAGVMLAGSFNNWVPDHLAMQKTDSGWIYDVSLGPGKFWYKFIVDGRWIVDPDNLLSENDGLGNTNSVFFRPNIVLTLDGFTDAKNVYVAGSFNGWKRNALPMQKTVSGWKLPLYLAEGTHTYKFIADGKWYQDGTNAEAVPDGVGGFNSVMRLGRSYLFQLAGHTEAKEVMLVGSFNQWRDFEWPLKKTATGWAIPFTLGPGNHGYKFKVDGRLIPDPANSLTSAASGTSYLILEPNYIFRLAGFSRAKKVYLAGDFNQWDPQSFAMKKEGNGWTLPVHLPAGKHLYKFIVDGTWITDPGNKLWEQNEYGTGNSVIWIEK